MKDEQLYLLHIQECIEWVEKFTCQRKAEFLSDKKTQDAVLRNLQILAESVQHPAPHYSSKCPDIPWKSISDFRNVIVHEYLGIDLELIWDVVERDLPVLKRNIQKIMGH